MLLSLCTGSNRPLLLIIVYPNEGGVAGYGNRTTVNYTAKWGLQIAEMIFQTRSSNLKAPKSMIFCLTCILILQMDCTGKMFQEIFFYDSRGVYQIRLNILWWIFLIFLNLLLSWDFYQILMQRLFRAGLRAFVAENAFCPIFTFAGFFVDLHVHRTYLQAFTAVDAFPLVAVNAQQGKIAHRLEKYCDRTQVFAERTVILEN